MIHRRGSDHPAVHIDPVGVQIVEMAGRRHNPHVDREKRVGHLTFNGSLQFHCPLRTCMKQEGVSLSVEGGKEGYTLHMVPMKVGQEDISAYPSLAKLLRETLSKPPKTRPAIQDDERAVSQPDFHACRVTSVAGVTSFGCRRRPTHTPKSDRHFPSPRRTRTMSGGSRQHSRFSSSGSPTPKST